MGKKYLVSPEKGAKRYSGTKGQQLFKTRLGAEDRVKKVRKLTGKTYHITEID